MSVRAPVERRVNTAAGWCGTGGNAPLVFEEDLKQRWGLGGTAPGQS